MPSQQEIKTYYDKSTWDYKLYSWTFGDDISMHFGLWDDQTRTHKEALKNENRIVAEITHITNKDFVLDLGCGYGSTAAWLAANIGCTVTGITLSEKQRQSAKRLAKTFDVANRTEFFVMDFHQTTLPDVHFDVVVAIESISHSNDKERVLKEAWRVLRPGGRLVVADGFFNKSKNNLSQRDQEIAKSCFEGVHVPPLAEQREFAKMLETANFKNTQWIDKTKSVLPTAKRIHRIAQFLLPISYLLKPFKTSVLNVSHVKAFRDQYYAWTSELGVYGIFYATKPL